MDGENIQTMDDKMHSVRFLSQKYKLETDAILGIGRYPSLFDKIQF